MARGDSRIALRTWSLGTTTATLLCVSSILHADDALHYNADVRPILADYCFACHGADSAARQADLRLDQREAAIEFGAMTPGEPDESELISRIFSDDPDLVMPPAETKKSLSPEQKETLRRWIAAGAEYQPHWSFIAPQRPELPAVQNEAWIKTPIDRFILARLESAGLSPAEPADPRTLFRRLHLDITGLPPAPDDVEAFVSGFEAGGDTALATWIDRLMARPAWGEHRARYWLDAARYADTHGLHFDNYREMWPYRDWVIQAFNANQPFDQFVLEQLAGDLLPDPTPEQLIATGFQRCNITTNEGGTIDEENLALYAADRVQTFGWVFLGLTTNCSQCHDHKFDPFSMKDYYSLAAFFRNTTQKAKDGNVKDGLGPVMVVPSPEDRPRWEALPGVIEQAIAAREQRKNSARGDFETWLAGDPTQTLDAQVPAEGLIVHLPLNGGAGSAVANACDPSQTVSTTGEVAWVDDGKLGPAPVVKAGGTFELGGLGDFEKDRGFSYGAWIRAAGDSGTGGIIARMDEQAGYRGWDLWQQGRSVAVHIIDSWADNALKVTTSEAVLTPGQWQHVFATYDGSGKTDGIRIYVDGKPAALRVEAGTLKPEATIRTQTPLRIGQRSHSQVFEGGGVQDVRIYDRTLTAAEVKTMAEIVPLRTILATPAAERTSEQNEALYEHYLAVRDPQYPGLSKAVVDLEAEREVIRARSPVTHIQEERKDAPAMAHVLMRGEYDRPGEEVPATTPAALHPPAEGAPPNRLGLARWLLDPANPLTTRVTVNRFWQQIFGQGIVVTPEDFGVMGALPTHPELLDWLAIEFRDSGWDVKRLFKLMLMSNTYRQSAAITPEKLELDRDNELLSRGPRFRMDAEMVRDNALAVSGLLSARMYGPSTKPYQPEAIWDVVGLPGGDTRNYVQDTGENLYRRSLYNFWKRMAPPPNLEAFNAPSREVCTVQRERTNTPLQALVTLNDPQFVEAARHLAQDALAAAGHDEVVVNQMGQRALGRPLSAEESAILLTDRQEYHAYYAAHPEDARALITIGESAPPEGVDAAVLAAWTMVGNQLLNLDETLNK
jgi:hypothetical protein